jgi:dTDP-glucose pyrophosphorylase
MKISNHTIKFDAKVKAALEKLENLPNDSSKTLFVIKGKKVIGTITDGDIRRGLIDGLGLMTSISTFMNKDYLFLQEEDPDTIIKIKQYRKKGAKLIPVLKNGNLHTLVNLDIQKSYIPVAALIMAGGKGERLKPLTSTVPKPMLKIGDKPILEHNIDRLITFGINTFYISVLYLKEQIISYFGDGSSKGIKIYYLEEKEPLGTLGCLSLINVLSYDNIFVMNSDILTNIDVEDFYINHISKNSSMTVASVPYKVDIPYAVLEIQDSKIVSFKEKPTFTYYSNGGIYLIKCKNKNLLKYNEFFNATDMLELLISNSQVVLNYPILEYWLDIGRHEDYTKAQIDIKHLKL